MLSENPFVPPTFKIENNIFVFPNGTVGKKYIANFDYTGRKLRRQIGSETFDKEITRVTVEGLETIGLEFDDSEKKIVGTPIKDGEFEFEMNVWTDDELPEKDKLRLRILINADPRTKWKDIPTPIEIEYYKPDRYFQKFSFDSRTIVAASIRGRSHAHEGKPRDDDFAIGFFEPTHTAIMVVADGAGSAKYSRKGSEIASQTVRQVCVKELEQAQSSLLSYIEKGDIENLTELLEGILLHAVNSACDAIKEEAEEQQRESREYATTLLVTLCQKIENKFLVLSWWVGDGAIAIYDNELQQATLVGMPDSGEFAGQTRFLTMPEIVTENTIRQRIRSHLVENFTAIILMTDGVCDPKFDTDSNLQNNAAWVALWKDLGGENEMQCKVDFKSDQEIEEQLFTWLNFWSRGNHDDRTIVILY